MNIASLTRVALAAALSLLCPLPGVGQWSDDFSGGTAALPATWQGDLAHFVVDPAGRLRLAAPAAGQSILHTRLPYRESMRWEFFLHLDFPPSATNTAGILLWGDQPDPSTATGHYLEVGENGSADALRLYRIEKGARNLLASGTTGAMAGNSPMARVRLDRDAGGQWTLWADYTGGTALKQEFSVHDPLAPGDSAHFALRCVYTATRTDKFYFDDLAVRPLLPDTEPPKLVSLEVIDSQEVRLLFDEDLEGGAASDPSRYRLHPGEREPALAEWKPGIPREVRLVWDQVFAPFGPYTVRIDGMADLAGNLSDTLGSSFTYLPIRAPGPGELLIHEIMADPSPAAGLPAVEYLELYNASGAVLDLQGLRVASGSSAATLTKGLLWPDSLIVLVRPEHEALFAVHGPVLGVTSLPALPNEGGRLQLLTPGGELLHEVEYHPSWHATTVKADGGWSLEMVSPALRCLRQGNWESSTDPSGGTPGRPNSVFRPEQDMEGPRLLQAWPLAADRLLLTFNERLEASPPVGAIRLEPGVTLQSLIPTTSGYGLEAVLTLPLQPGTVYRVTATLKDCLGNPGGPDAPLPTGLPERPEPGDLLLNEILFDPPVGGADFVELLNASGKVLSLESLLLGNIQPGKEDTRAVEVQALVLPGEHAVLCADTAFLRQQWPNVSPSSAHQVTLPSWPQDSGDVSLFFREGPSLTLLDRMAYREDMHFALLPDTKGVSLERIHPDAPAGMAASWHSAAEDAGFATPTQRNSQYRENAEPEEAPFTLADPVFSPNGDGDRDILLLRYRFPETGHMLSMKVFDRQGRQVKDLARELILGTEGILSWSGDSDEGSAAGPGAYILWMETWRPDGQVRRYKKAAILSLPMD